VKDDNRPQEGEGDHFSNGRPLNTINSRQISLQPTFYGLVRTLSMIKRESTIPNAFLHALLTFRHCRGRGSF